MEKQVLNTITILSLSEIPYFGYELARKVVKYREENGSFSRFRELLNIKGFPADKIDRIKLYLTIDLNFNCLSTILKKKLKKLLGLYG